MFSPPWLLSVCSLPSSVLLYILRKYIPQLPIRSGQCMVLEENWMREEGSKGICHLQSHWICPQCSLSTASSSWVPASGWLFLDPARGLKRQKFYVCYYSDCHFSSLSITAWWGPCIQFSVFEVLEWLCFLDGYAHLYWYCSLPRASVRWWVSHYSRWGKGRKKGKSFSINMDTSPWDCFHWVTHTTCQRLFICCTLFLLSVWPWVAYFNSMCLSLLIYKTDREYRKQQNAYPIGLLGKWDEILHVKSLGQSLAHTN